MDNLKFSFGNGRFQIEGFPEAEKVIALKDKKAKKLADLALDLSDLNFSKSCLLELESIEYDRFILRQALWRGAVIHYCKCFGGSDGRANLNAKKILQGDLEAQSIHKDFVTLRNKHIVHDENPFNQCLPGAILNSEACGHKIAKIVTSQVLLDTLTQDNFNNLGLLIEKALEFVKKRFDSQCDYLTQGLECLSYEELSSYEELRYTAPGSGDLGRNRHRK